MKKLLFTVLLLAGIFASQAHAQQISMHRLGFDAHLPVFVGERAEIGIYAAHSKMWNAGVSLTLRPWDWVYLRLTDGFHAVDMNSQAFRADVGLVYRRAFIELVNQHNAQAPDLQYVHIGFIWRR